MLLILAVAALVLSPGIALADEDHGTSSPTSTEHSESGDQEQHGHSHGKQGNKEGGLLGGWLTVISGLFLLGTATTAPAYQYLNTGQQEKFKTVEFLALLLTIFSASVHLYLFLAHGTMVMLLAGLGFVGGVGLFFTGIERRYLYLTGIVYTLIQIPLWINDGMPHLGSFGLLDKTAQVVLILTLGYLYWKNR